MHWLYHSESTSQALPAAHSVGPSQSLPPHWPQGSAIVASAGVAGAGAGSGSGAGCGSNSSSPPVSLAGAAVVGAAVDAAEVGAAVEAAEVGAAVEAGWLESVPLLRIAMSAQFQNSSGNLEALQAVFSGVAHCATAFGAHAAAFQPCDCISWK